jgi:glycosyltransferase involved in cell wall biosynthesis
VPDLLQAADALLIASRIEGMPGVAIEAAFLGVPVIAYAHAGIPEIVVDGVTGFLVRPGDTATLADRLGDVLSDPARRHEMGVAARQVAPGFSIGPVADRYRDLYERLDEVA